MPHCPEEGSRRRWTSPGARGEERDARREIDRGIRRQSFELGWILFVRFSVSDGSLTAEVAVHLTPALSTLAFRTWTGCR
ncbi:MAG TPA: hypothetical protein VJN70_12260, partial [Gemmatimonadaceae bacterium]|nr:hypothetical protein [Gemmatimonadaceae bacterium]